jgi:diaminopimelate decarboxylase
LENGQAKFAITSLLGKNIPISSLHLHLGSNLYDPNLYTKSISIVINFIKEIYSNFGIKLKYLDLGGGFPSHGPLPHHLHTRFQPLESYLKPILSKLQKLPYTLTLILEPGRYLVDDATIFISKVIHSNLKDRRQQIIIDSTINQLPLTWTRPNIVATFSPNLIQLKQTITPTTIYGASCQEIDILYQGNFPKVSPNDLIIFYCCGAYNQNMTPDFIFKKPSTYFL